MKELVERVQSDPRYQRNIQYGKARPGHPEATVAVHIEELEDNLERMRARLSDEE